MAEIPPPPAKKPGLFSTKPKPQAAPDVTPLRDEINSLSTRIKLVEERHTEFRNRFHLVEQNVINYHKKSMSDKKSMGQEIQDIKRTMREIENRIITIIKEIQLTAKREDVDVLKKYLDLWNPVEFARIGQVEKMIDEKLRKFNPQIEKPLYTPESVEEEKRE